MLKIINKLNLLIFILNLHNIIILNLYYYK